MNENFKYFNEKMRFCIVFFLIFILLNSSKLIVLLTDSIIVEEAAYNPQLNFSASLSRKKKMAKLMKSEASESEASESEAKKNIFGVFNESKKTKKAHSPKIQ